jgi:Mg-chelatase subunit ChlD
MTNIAKHQVFNLIILDESGSMASVKNVTMAGFNETVQTIQGAQKKFPEQEHSVSLVTFNSMDIRTVLDNQPAEALTLLTDGSYQPDGGTPLFDAMGRSLMRLEFQTEHLSDFTILVSILTDGHENASQEFSGSAIKAMIDRLTEKGWTFTYMGANHNVEQMASSLSIKSFLRFESTQEGMDELFRKDRNSRHKFYQKRSSGMSSKDAEKGFWDEE